MKGWALVALAGLMGSGAVAQLDTIRMVSLGTAWEEGGVAVASLGEDAAVFGFTDAGGGRSPWVVRLDTNLQVVWQRALPVQGTAVAGVVAGDGSVLVVSRELLPAAAGYGVCWHRLDAETGEVLAEAALATGAWLLPSGLSMDGDSVFTWVTDYASGTAQPGAVLSTWSSAGHTVLQQWSWGNTGTTEALVAGTRSAGAMWVASTVRPALDSAHGRIRKIDDLGGVLWENDPEIEGAFVEACALSVVDSVAVLGLTRDEDGPTPKPFLVRYDTAGVMPPVLVAPTNPAQVRGVRWNAPEINALFRTEVFGLGEGDMIHVRMGPSGQFIGAMSFGWEEAEEPAMLMKDGLGAVWLIGSTEHGNPNVHVVRSPNDQIGDHELHAFETMLDAPLGVAPLDGRLGPVLVPNPASDRVELRGMPCEDAAYVAFTLHGTVIGQGVGPLIDVSHWPTGTYLIDVTCESVHFSLRLLRF